MTSLLSFKYTVFVFMLACIVTGLADMLDFPSLTKRPTNPKDHFSKYDSYSSAGSALSGSIESDFQKLDLENHVNPEQMTEVEKRDPLKSPNNPYYGYIGLGKRIFEHYNIEPQYPVTEGADSSYLDEGEQSEKIADSKDSPRNVYLDFDKRGPTKSNPAYSYLGLGKRGPTKSNPAYSYLGLGKRAPTKSNPAYSYLGLGKRGPTKSNPAYSYLGLGKRGPMKTNPAYGYLGLGKKSVSEEDGDAIILSDELAHSEDGSSIEKVKKGPSRYNPGYSTITLGKKTPLDEMGDDKELLSNYLEKMIKTDQYYPYISVGAISNLRDFFKNLKYNIHSLENKGETEDIGYGSLFGDKAETLRTTREDPLCSPTNKCKDNPEKSQETSSYTL